MRITIAERLSPFSHEPGTYCMLPGSPIRLQVFPALLKVYNLSGIQPQLISEIPLNVEGPVKNFTVIQDFNKQLVRVEGTALNGFFRYICSMDDEHVILKVEKAPPTGLIPEAKSTFIICPLPSSLDRSLKERLSLGSHKAQDWEKMRRRLSMVEIFPIWHQLGQMIPIKEIKPLPVFDECQKAIDSHRPETIVSAFNKVFLAHFEKMLSPRLEDIDHQGIILPSLQESPLYLLKQGSALIRSLFFREDKGEAFLLPTLPPEFHCGRMTDVMWQDAGVIDFEWTKKCMRRLVLKSKNEGQVCLHFQKVKSFRLRDEKQARGSRMECGVPFKIRPDQVYYLDNFQS